MGLSRKDLIPPVFKDREFKRALYRILGVRPYNTSLYKKALKHRSVAEKESDSNERLEFLGDAVLGAVVSEYLFARFPYKNEGFLTKMRSKVVNRQFLNSLSRKIGINELVEYQAGINDRFTSLHGDAFEALIGALYLDRGYPAAKKFIINRLFKYFIDLEEVENYDGDFKSRLINYCQKEKFNIKFEAVEHGKGRTRHFKVKILINEEAKGAGEGFSKKIAEQNASRMVCELLKID